MRGEDIKNPNDRSTKLPSLIYNVNNIAVETQRRAVDGDFVLLPPVS